MGMTATRPAMTEMIAVAFERTRGPAIFHGKRRAARTQIDTTCGKVAAELNQCS